MAGESNENEEGPKKADINKDILGNKVSIKGEETKGSLDGVTAAIEGAEGAFLIEASLKKNDAGYLVTGQGNFSNGILTGALTGSISTQEDFTPIEDSLQVSGQASVSQVINGITLELSGQMENGSLQGLVGTITGPNGAYSINASVVDNGETYLITGQGAFVAGPIEGSVTAEIQSDPSFNIDPSTLNLGGQLSINQEVAGITFSFTGNMENGSLAGLTGTITGANNSFLINASVQNNGDVYTLSGQGAYTNGPIQGGLIAEITTDESFQIDPNTINLGGNISLATEVAGNDIQLSGTVENNSLASLMGTVTGPSQIYSIGTTVEKSGDNYLITGEGAFVSNFIEGQLVAQILTDAAFNIDPSSFNVGGSAEVNTEVAGIKIHLAGAVEEGQLSNLQGVVEGPNGLFIINVGVINDGEKYTITGEGAFAAGPLAGSLSAQIESDPSFVIDPSSLNISGQAALDTTIAGIRINLAGSVENGRLASLQGVIVGPEDFFTINASVTDQGDSYAVVGSGAFTAGPLEGNLSAELMTDSEFNPMMDQSNVSGSAALNTEIAGNIIAMSGALDKGELQSLEGNITGPNGLYTLAASVTNNGDTYTITGDGAFNAGPVEGTVHGEILTDKTFNPQLDSMQIGGEANVDTHFAGNHLLMTGSMENGSLQSLIGTVEGPNGMYLLNLSVINNGEGYTISGGGNFAAGPLEGQVTAEINTDQNFNPQIDSLNVSGEAAVDTHTAGHHIIMKGVMENGSLASLEGTVEGPNGLYMINASVINNGDTYTITGEGNFTNGPIEGSIHGTIDTDPNFMPDFSTLDFGGDAAIDTDVAGNKVNLTASVNNGYLESIAGTVEGPGGFYTIHAAGQREGEEGYDIEASGAFTFFDESYTFEPPPILLPVGIPGVNIEISGEVGFGAKASADIVTGFKTNPHFVPDFSTFEIRSATLLGHGEVNIGIFGGINVGLPFASVSAGIKAQLKGVIDAIMTLTADSKGLKVSGNLYAALLGALYAAVKLKFLFFKKEFDFLIVEGKVASIEKDFGPTDFTLENILKGFAFGMDDISIPGKDKKAKAPEIKEEDDKSNEEIEKAKSEDKEEKKEKEDPKEKEVTLEEDDEEEGQTAQMKAMGSGNSGRAPIQQQANEGGLPANIQHGVEKLSGQNMSDVQVHRNSDKPAQLNAHAYAQGNQIHLGPGQEKHLPHEAWHVAQQKQGRVKPTKQLKSDVQINDDEGLEKEADLMGQKALGIGDAELSIETPKGGAVQQASASSTTQLKADLDQLQNAANNSENVSQLQSLGEIANQDQGDEIHQLQSYANDFSSNFRSSVSNETIQNKNMDTEDNSQDNSTETTAI